ncbi:MAG: ABC transporter permease [Rhizobiales bacterium]|nr:ABC transporter permease [Hyphomicrobiales bacterium]
MGFFILRRLLLTLPVMAVVALFVFSLLYVAPGDPAAVLAGDQATPAELERIRLRLGLDQSFAVRFANWALAALQGDLGSSLFSGQSVSSMIAQRLVPTLSLMVLTLIISVSVAVPLGVFAAARQGSMIDRAISSFAVLGFSLPVFVVGYLLAYTLALQLGWFPVQGYVPPSAGFGPFLCSLVLPALALSGGYVALITRITRSTMLEVLAQDYVRAAKAKGVTRRTVLFLHALKNAALPIISIVGIGIAALISGAVVTETVFGIPGLGRLIVDALLRRDYPIIQGVVLVFSFAYIIVNLAIDVLYTLLDPRVRY